MRQDLKRLGRESLIYGLSTVVGRLLNFILIPFYTHTLVPSEYGIVATVFAYLAFLNVLYQYGMDQAYLRYASTLDIGDLQDNFSTPMWSLAATSLCLSGLLYFFASPITRLIGLPLELADIPVYCAVILALDAVATIPFMELRRSHRKWAYVGIRTANIAVNVALNIWFLWRWHWGVRGVFMASVAASATSVLLTIPILLKLWRPAFNRKLFPALVSFAAPYVPSGLASMAVQVIDRPILKALTNDATVGIYQANYRLGIFMMLIVNMFDTAWRPFFMERADKPGSRELFGRVLTYFLLGGSFLTLALSFFIGDIVRFPIFGKPLIAPAYWSGLPIVPVVLIGYLFNGAYINFMVQATWTKRTGILIWATVLGAAVNVGANLILIPSMGMMGAAIATLLAYAAMAISLFVMGQQVYPIPYEYSRLFQMLAVAGIVSFGVWQARGAVHSHGAWVLFRAVALCAYPGILWLWGFFNEEELAAIIPKFRPW